MKAEIRAEAVTEYKGFTAGPDAEISKEIILVEGSSDVKNLLKHGVKNAVAIEGTSVPKGIEDICEDKDVTAFLDGDRGGELILKELKQKNIPRYFARATEKTEVEELNNKQVHEALRDRKPVKYVDVEEVEKDMPSFEDKFRDLVGTRAAETLDEERETLERVPASNLSSLESEAFALVLDGEIGQKAVNIAEELNMEYVAGKSRSSNANSSKVKIITRKENAEA